MFIDGVDANRRPALPTVYISRSCAAFARAGALAAQRGRVVHQVSFLYNPALPAVGSLAGVIGIVLTLIATLVSAVTLVRE